MNYFTIGNDLTNVVEVNNMLRRINEEYKLGFNQHLFFDEYFTSVKIHTRTGKRACC